jgi:Cu-Zn family superoxide dismutase
MLRLTLLTVMIAACYAAVPIKISPVFPIKAVSVINGMTMTPEAARLHSLHQDPSVDIPGITFISGRVEFVQKGADEPVDVQIDITFNPPTQGQQLRGIHVHTFGLLVESDNVTEVCDSTGPHYNPLKTAHGSLRSTIRHPGDFGNVPTVDGIIFSTLTVPGLKLYGDESIIGLSIVLHDKTDDLGMGVLPASKINGNAGPKIACGDIIFDKTA